eukprot:3725896-Pleurochrysis_carterae.AAC.1
MSRLDRDHTSSIGIIEIETDSKAAAYCLSNDPCTRPVAFCGIQHQRVLPCLNHWLDFEAPSRQSVDACKIGLGSNDRPTPFTVGLKLHHLCKSKSILISSAHSPPVAVPLVCLLPALREKRGMGGEGGGASVFAGLSAPYVELVSNVRRLFGATPEPEGHRTHAHVQVGRVEKQSAQLVHLQRGDHVSERERVRGTEGEGGRNKIGRKKERGRQKKTRIKRRETEGLSTCARARARFCVCLWARAPCRVQ